MLLGTENVGVKHAIKIGMSFLHEQPFFTEGYEGQAFEASLTEAKNGPAIRSFSVTVSAGNNMRPIRS
ncbi:MAG: hypothetical protein ACJA1W_003893 [Akkermansiaceae bacterium]